MNDKDFDAFKKDIDAAERKLAGEIEPGGRALVVAVLVFVLLVAFMLPHTGGARGWDALLGGPAAAEAAVTLPLRAFAWLALVFSVGFSMLALLTRRWVLAFLALAGSGLASAAGMLAVWSRQTAEEGQPGPSYGLVIAWIAVILLTFHWARVVWARTAVHLAAEEERRRAATELQARTLLESLDEQERRKDESGGAARPGG